MNCFIRLHEYSFMGKINLIEATLITLCLLTICRNNFLETPLYSANYKLVLHDPVFHGDFSCIQFLHYRKVWSWERSNLFEATF